MKRQNVILVSVLCGCFLFLSSLFIFKGEQHAVHATSLPAIQDLSIQGNILKWTAPANVKKYSILFYTGEATATGMIFGGCIYDSYQDQYPNGTQYCAGIANNITRIAGSTESFYVAFPPVHSYVVKYEDLSGNISSYSNVVIHKNTITSIPPVTNLQLVQNDDRLNLDWNDEYYGTYNLADEVAVRFYTGEMSAQNFTNQYLNSVPSDDEFNLITWERATTNFIVPTTSHSVAIILKDSSTGVISSWSNIATWKSVASPEYVQLSTDKNGTNSVTMNVGEKFRLTADLVNGSGNWDPMLTGINPSQLRCVAVGVHTSGPAYWDCEALQAGSSNLQVSKYNTSTSSNVIIITINASPISNIIPTIIGQGTGKSICMTLNTPLNTNYTYSLDCQNIMGNFTIIEGKILEKYLYGDNIYTNCRVSVLASNKTIANSNVFDFNYLDYSPLKISCTDSDNGKDYYKVGKVEGYRLSDPQQKVMLQDDCMGVDMKKITEHYCDSNGYVQSETFDCPYGCTSDGACKINSNNTTCSTLYYPVCGSNGITYSNYCNAQLAGIYSYTAGNCGTSTNNTYLPPAGYEDSVITAFNQYENPFSDTNLSTLEGQAAAELYRRAVIGGYSDGEFKGNRLLNRAEVAKFLLLARYGIISDLLNNSRFTDVLDGQWYTKYVMKASQLGIIQGYSDGTFGPEKLVNTVEFLKMLTLTFGLTTNFPYTYTDVKSSDWFAPYAGAAQKYNLFPNRITNLYPSKGLTRYEVAVAIYQYLINR